jgi:hypothetical protein
MTSRDEAMRRRLAPALATADREYRASSGEVPIELLAPLFAAILTFGVFLTAFVEIAKVLTMTKAAEWTARRARTAQEQGRPQGPEGSLGKLASSLIARAAARVHTSLLGP